VDAPYRGPGSLVSRDPRRRLLRWKWKGLPGSWRDPWAYAVLGDPGRALAPGHCGARVLSPTDTTGTTSTNSAFRGSITRPRPSLSTLRSRPCGTPTQDSLPAGGQPLPGGIRTRWVPSGKFPALLTAVYITFPFPQALPGARCQAPFRDRDRPGRASPPGSPRRSGRADFPHPAPRNTVSLRDLRRCA
jgi:hypothetical protein